MNGEAGKGDKLRPGANLNLYWENYDNIFRKNKDMIYNIATAKEGDIFYECQYGENIEMVALENVRRVNDSDYNDGYGYELQVATDKGKIVLKQSANPRGYGLRLYKTPQYI